MILPTTDEFLFRTGLSVSDYFIDESHGFELICFIDASGREFDLHVSDGNLKTAAVARLRSLGVHIRT